MIRPQTILWLALVASLATPALARGQFAVAPMVWQGAPGRQVVVFGVQATPDSRAMDPKIAPVVQAQLRKLLPGHGFKLIKIKSERATAGQSVPCDLGLGMVATAQMVNPNDPNGRVQLRFDLASSGISEFQTVVITPPDQFNFFDKKLPNNDHLLIGIGAR